MTSAATATVSPDSSVPTARPGTGPVGRPVGGRPVGGRLVGGRLGALPGSPSSLLHQARLVLCEAAATAEGGERFRLAHLAALRVAAAVLAARGRPASARRRIVSAWVLIDAVAPEWRDWATYFAASAPARAALEAGSVNVVSTRQADDQLRAAVEFLTVVETDLGMLGAPLAC